LSYYLCNAIMKKLIASFAVVVYFAFACGVLVNFHYCMDRYDSYSLYKAASDWCPTCHMHTGTRGCCHDEVKIIKLQDDHQTSSFSFASKDVQPPVVTLSEFLAIIPLKEDIGLERTDHSPPLLSQPDIYIQNRVFRI
jgi:hypothetical protein